LRHALSRAEVDRREVVAHLTGLVAPILDIAQAELAEVVEPPTLDRAVVEKGARVIAATCSQSDSSSPNTQVHGH
jgi:hypothetical protein